MADENYWKNAYQQTWKQSSTREDTIKNMIAEATDKEVELIGLGAGSSDYLSGSAESHGHERGGSDLVVVGTDIFIEVTGPLVDTVPESAPLWIRPDKIASARRHSADSETWVVHCLGNTGVIRVIHLNSEFFEQYDRGTYPTATPLIRGRRETYIEIPASSPCVQPLDVLVEHIRSI